MESSSGGDSGEANGDRLFHRVLSASLDPKKSWFALNSTLCGGKPSRFCSFGYAQVFPDEYRQVEFDGLFGDNGVPASASWFSSSGRRIDKVYVASAFGLVLGILRQKSLDELPFIHSDEFQMIVAWINALDLSASFPPTPPSTPSPPKPNCAAFLRKQHQDALLVPPSAPGLSKPNCTPFFRQQHQDVSPKSEKQKSFPPTPPSTPSPPKPTSAPFAQQQLLDITPKSEKRRRTLEELKANEELSPAFKKKKIRVTAKEMMKEITGLCERNGESLSTVLGECCCLTGKAGLEAREIFTRVFDSLVQEKGVRVAFSKLLSEEAWDERVKSMRVPDWVYLLFKLKSRISDSAWQDLTNLTKLGRTGKKSDEAIIPLKNNVAALRKGLFNVTRNLIDIERLPPQVPGYEVNLKKVAIWVIREMRLHGSLPDDIVFNLKIDGRPFFGKDQVSVGFVALDAKHRSSQSAKSVYPLAIANCKEKREDLRKLLLNLNKRKEEIKRNGIWVDGKHYRIRFKVTLDYKGLLLLMAKVDDENFLLGGQGLAVEFCIFCSALRVSLSYCIKKRGYSFN